MRTITIFGGNLFEIASAQLGSAMQWINIAKINNFSDPFLSGKQTLIVPLPSADFADGIGPQ